MGQQERKRSIVRLHLADGVGPVTYRRIMEVFDDPAAIFDASRGQLMKADGVGPKTAEAILAVTADDVDRQFELADKIGATIITIEDEDYPAALKTIYDPPPVLYVRGRLERADAVGFGIVGSRHCTHYGLEQSERFAGMLARAGMTIVSGGARGIDTAAHNGAMASGGRTVAVMGCGLGHTYPPENAKLFERIVAEDRGALVSELPIDTAVLAGNFPTRNRIISGMSLGVLVVEAGKQSGALITAKESNEQGRLVFALPGRVDSPLSQGTNELIRNGAMLAQCIDDILEQLGQVGQTLATESPAEQEGRTQNLIQRLDENERKLYDALAGGQLSLDDLVRRTGLATGPAAAAMTMLVLKGAVAQQAGNVFARKSLSERPESKGRLF